MSKYLLLLILVISVGCSCESDAKKKARTEEQISVKIPQGEGYDLMRFEDKEKGTICYRVKNYDGLSCMYKKESGL